MIGDWGQKEKRASEDEMAGQHHWCNEHEFGQTLGDDEEQGGLVCCSSWGCKESDTTGWLNNHSNKFVITSTLGLWAWFCFFFSHYSAMATEVNANKTPVKVFICILFLFQNKITQYHSPQDIEPKSVSCCPVIILSPVLSFFCPKPHAFCRCFL